MLSYLTRQYTSPEIQCLGPLVVLPESLGTSRTGLKAQKPRRLDVFIGIYSISWVESVFDLVM